ncbi:D-alanyl-lipoteichoic acid acyltransferase DltB, MBOAT superfamily [Propionispira arboris]|uniref:D-alanyl-lipoteichoic acid acyltransferase DltB, MBOAT superfamily n=2 Tax=Propionispira arboris TaxID=84035 RepID=A0A1H6TY29_9FIRM|nr:D-alanyl-lipoteichoic acid acyltransferase DltB, MBOAT superfamily [Propionispira arboris]
MLFNSYEFLFFFLPVAMGIFYFIVKLKSKRLAVPWLVFVSFIFYAWWNPVFLILLGASVCFNYGVGYFLLQKNYHSYKNIKPIYLLIFGVFINLLALAYYKYFNFFILNMNTLFNLSIPSENIILPIGISFFTFTQIAFLVDAYRGCVEEYRFISYMLFVTFFPHLIAGPILHHKEMMSQFESDKLLKVNWENIIIGTVVFILGLFKKVIIADHLALYATPIFDAAAQGNVPQLFEAWIGALAYTLQLYFDFSGYSDMAIGLALLCNVRLPVNFFSPYKAKSVIDFWRRWHMTLSRYLKDYVYIPLGGNRYGEFRRLRNLLVTMLLGGIWHGAGWTFFVWGGLHGFYLIVNHTWRKFEICLPNIINWGLTFVSVVTAWVFFRADTLQTAILIIKGMFGFNGISLAENLAYRIPLLSGFGFDFSGFMTITNLSLTKVVPWILIALIIVLLLPNTMELTAAYKPALRISAKNIETKYVQYWQWKPSYVWSIALGIIAVLSILSMSNVSAFLYFQF